LDPGSAEAFKNDPECAEFLQTKSALWENTEKLSTFLGRAKEFDVIFYPGGHGRRSFPLHRALKPLTEILK
jgi:putative intracellular protease/amidase